MSTLRPAIALGLATCGAAHALASQEPPEGAWRTYRCVRVDDAPVVDGRLDDRAWQAARWSNDFVDIAGDLRAAPRWRTRMKLLWDEHFLYVGAQLDEPHVWATLTERDAVIYHDDDFEIFIDPDGDTHEYYELEINALGTVWDLFLVRPYRDGGPALHGWDIAGLRSAVAVDGTLNDPSDRDRGWSVELAIPWSALVEAAPHRARPETGDRWRMNFSRVDWDVHIAHGAYRKERDADGHSLPEHNWVWSPQGVVDMHRPEMWGIVEFAGLDDVSDGASGVVAPDPDQAVHWMLRQVYYAQRDQFERSGRYTEDWKTLAGRLKGFERLPSVALHATATEFEATAPGVDRLTRWHIRQDGKIWRTR